MKASFVERRFRLDEASDVIARFSWPAPDEVDFRCDYEIVWPDRTRSFHSCGVDQVQALTLAMQAAHCDLLASSEWKSGRLTYLGARDLDLPLPSSLDSGDFD